jgi:energy-coupling factor transporter ATP-binding protein EcfA2
MIRLSELRITLSPETSILIPPLDLNLGSVYLLLGDSGCGKSTFLKSLAGFIPSSSMQGTIPPIHTALLLQNPMYQMITSTVDSELKFPLIQQGYTTGEIQKKVEETADFFGLTALMNEKLYHLSFGELQTVMLATTLLIPADLYLLDEPTSHLDYPMIERMFNWIRKNVDASGAGCIIASQFPDEYCYSDRILLFSGHTLKENIPSCSYPEYTVKNPHAPDLSTTETEKYLNDLEI